MISNNKVKITCYGKEETMNRIDAMKFYKECMMCSEGSEHERYESIYWQLKQGALFCYDDLDDMVYSAFSQLKAKAREAGVEDLSNKYYEKMYNDIMNGANPKTIVNDTWEYLHKPLGVEK